MKKIDSYIQSEFNHIKEEVNTQLKGSYNINQKKEFLATYIPKEIMFRSEALVDTLINLMMSEAIEDLEEYDTFILNKFFDADFESKIQNVTRELNLQLILEPEKISFSRDPRLKNGIVAGGFVFVLGSTATSYFYRTSNLESIIITGITTLLLSGLAYKVTYGKYTEQALDKLQNDIHTFLSTAEQQVKKWLYSIRGLFETEFNKFLTQHHLQ